MVISFVVAMARNRVIGRDNRLPWHLPADLRHFKALTWGKPVLMGRRTCASIGKPLPGRTNIVVSRDPGFRAPGVTVVRSIDEGLAAAADAPELMVIGGASLYRALLPKAGRIYLTVIAADFEGDTWFPELPEGQWREVEREEHAPDEKNPYPYCFLRLERVAR